MVGLGGGGGRSPLGLGGRGGGEGNSPGPPLDKWGACFDDELTIAGRDDS